MGEFSLVQLRRFVREGRSTNKLQNSVILLVFQI